VKHTIKPGTGHNHTMHPQAPRTAYREVGSWERGFDTAYRTWPSRESMARSIRMQQQRAPQSTDWTPCIRLAETEGY